jgi:hypothetical protein
MCDLYYSTRSCDRLNRCRLKRELSIALAYVANSPAHSAGNDCLCEIGR